MILQRRNKSKEEWVSAYLYDLANKNRRVVGWLHEDSPRDNFTVVECLSTQARFSQAACIDQLEHLIRYNKEQCHSYISKWCAMPYILRAPIQETNYLLVHLLNSKYKITYLEIRQWAGLGAQRLSILIGLSPLDCFIGCKLVKGRTEAKRQKYDYMSGIFLSKLYDGLKSPLAAVFVHAFASNLWLEPIRTILVLFFVKTPKPTWAIK